MTTTLKLTKKRIAEVNEQAAKLERKMNDATKPKAKYSAGDVQDAIKGFLMPQFRRFVKLSNWDGKENEPKTLGNVRGFLFGAGGGFNQATWDTIQVTANTTIDQLVKKMRSSKLMENFIRAWGKVETAGFYSVLVRLFIERANILIAEYGEETLYADLVDYNETYYFQDDEQTDPVEDFTGKYTDKFFELVADGFPMAVWIEAKNEFFGKQNQAMPLDEQGHVTGIDDLFDMLDLAELRDDSKAKKMLREIARKGMNLEAIKTAYHAIAKFVGEHCEPEANGAFEFLAPQQIFEIIEVAEDTFRYGELVAPILVKLFG